MMYLIIAILGCIAGWLSAMAYLAYAFFKDQR